MSCGAIVIAGTGSGSGKTSISIGLTAALVRRGLRVATFKVGPDFLDPSYLAIASGRKCYNLDSWMCGEEYIKELFASKTADADIAIVEGVMGMFDGASPDSLEGSTAEVAKILGAGVLLVAGAHGMGASFAAMVKGFCDFEDGVNVTGVIANRTGTERHKKWLEKSLDGKGLPKLLGAVRRESLPRLPSRHLGLVTADARILSEETITQLADACEEMIEMDGVINVAKQMPAMKSVKHKEKTAKTVRLGVARDEAFHFYYPDNLEALENAGCELVEFSPIRDGALPEGLGALYFGGGYPEEFAKELSENKSMLKSVKEFAASGKTVYAECGGFMYLGEKLIAKDGEEFEMTGVLEITTRMLERFKTLGYAEVTLGEDCMWGKKGQKLRGHEFHYSNIENFGEGINKIYSVQRRYGSEGSQEGFNLGNVLGSYVHLHWAGNKEAIISFANHIKG